jgi:hypothetical protein
VLAARGMTFIGIAGVAFAFAGCGTTKVIVVTAPTTSQHPNLAQIEGWVGSGWTDGAGQILQAMSSHCVATGAQTAQCQVDLQGQSTDPNAPFGSSFSKTVNVTCPPGRSDEASCTTATVGG